jgi:hypothetical protein
MARQLGVILRAVGKDCKVRKYNPSAGSYGTKPKYWIQERKGRKGKRSFKIWDKLDALGMTDIYCDEIIGLRNSQNETFDIEVPNGHTYLANGFISHNTSSLVLGCASGIHPHHASKYIRRVQCNKIDNVYRHFKKANPSLCEESVWSANKTDDVISFPIEVAEGTMLKPDLNAIKHLDIIKSTQQNWVNTGKTEANKKNINHNVSCTVICKPDEWDEVISYLFENRAYFSAVSLLGSSGDKDYQQAPMESMSTEDELKKFEEIKKNFKHVDYTKMVENDDETAPQNEIVCAGGACEIVRI